VRSSSAAARKRVAASSSTISTVFGLALMADGLYYRRLAAGDRRLAASPGNRLSTFGFRPETRDGADSRMPKPKAGAGSDG